MGADSLLKNNFEDYLKDDINIKLRFNIPDKIDDLNNIIIYGAEGTGKYTKALQIINNYSPSRLKYNKKILIPNNKNDYFIKISDIHYEVDMELLGCNSKTLWNDIYTNIIDIVNHSSVCRGIILCKNFHIINNELLEIFYSYMQTDIFNTNNVNNIKFIILTNHISFVPKSIRNICNIIRSEKMSINSYKKQFNIGRNVDVNVLNNLKHVQLLKDDYDIMVPYKNICDKILEMIIDYNSIDFMDLRNILYDLLILNLNIPDCIYYILSKLIENGALCVKSVGNEERMNELFNSTYMFFKYFNNNYRPIYHLENYILYLVKHIHEL